MEERTSKRLIKFKPQDEASMHHLYSRSSPSAVRHATDDASNGSNTPKPWQRLHHQQDPPAELSFLQSDSGLTDLVRELPRKGWVRFLLGCLGPERPWGCKPWKALGLRALKRETPQSGARLERALNPPRNSFKPSARQHSIGQNSGSPPRPVVLQAQSGPSASGPGKQARVLLTNLPWLGSHGLQPGSTMAPTALPTRTCPGAG